MWEQNTLGDRIRKLEKSLAGRGRRDGLVAASNHPVVKLNRDALKFRPRLVTVTNRQVVKLSQSQPHDSNV